MNFQPNVKHEAHFDNRYKQVEEMSKSFGSKFYYMQAIGVVVDDILNEFETKQYSNLNAHPIFAIKDNDSFLQGNESFGGFGFLPSYSKIIYIPKKSLDDLNIVPIEHDIIYDTIENSLYQVTNIDTNNDGYEGDKINNRQFNYKVYLKGYSASTSEIINTDVDKDMTDIDGALLSLDELESLTKVDANDNVNTPSKVISDTVVGDNHNPFERI